MLVSLAKMLDSFIFLVILLYNTASADGLMCPAGTFAIEYIDACIFVSTKTMDWNNAETVRFYQPKILNM